VCRAKITLGSSKLNCSQHTHTHTHTHAHTRLTALCPGLSGWDGARKVKAIWILLKQETVSGSGISWAVCKSVSLQTDNHTSTPPLSFYRPDNLPDAQPTASKHWRLFPAICNYFHIANAKRFHWKSAHYKIRLSDLFIIIIIIIIYCYTTRVAHDTYMYIHKKIYS